MVDARNYENGLSFNYWGAVFPSKYLDELVEEIPFSNPVYAIPNGGYDVVPSSSSAKAVKAAKPTIPVNLKLAKGATPAKASPNRRVPARLQSRILRKSNKKP